jgi:hypothetical protein
MAFGCAYLFTPIAVFIFMGSRRFLPNCVARLAVNNTIGRSDGGGSADSTSVLKTLFLKFVTTFLSVAGGCGVVGGVIEGRNDRFVSTNQGDDSGSKFIIPVSEYMINLYGS